MLETRDKPFLRSTVPNAEVGFDGALFARYVYQRKILLLTSCLVAVALAGLGSILIPPKYTATATILIQPPAGNDPRGATAVSPVYLESLKTYEHFASSDSLFRQALTSLGLHGSGASIESLKRRVLDVKKPKDEKILQISITWKDKADAQKLAQYIAEQTVTMNRSLETHSITELTRSAANLLDSAQTTLQRSRAARDAFLSAQPIAPVEAELATTTDLKSRMDRSLADAEVELAAALARFASQRETPENAGAVTKNDIAAIQAQVATLRSQVRAAAQHVAQFSALLEKRKQQREVLDKEVQTAQAQYETAITRRTDLLTSEAFRGERLEIIDPGIVPERPTSPNVPLNLAVAFFASLIGCIFYLAFRFAYET